MRFSIGEIIKNRKNQHFLIIDIKSIFKDSYYVLHSIEEDDRYSFSALFVEQYYQREK
jgi:hypothetical protein